MWHGLSHLFYISDSLFVPKILTDKPAPWFCKDASQYTESMCTTQKISHLSDKQVAFNIRMWVMMFLNSWVSLELDPMHLCFFWTRQDATKYFQAITAQLQHVLLRPGQSNNLAYILFQQFRRILQFLFMLKLRILDFETQTSYVNNMNTGSLLILVTSETYRDMWLSLI